MRKIKILFNFLIRIPAWIIGILIIAYQKTFSLDYGVFSFLYPNGFCRFHPSCSQYFYTAVDRFGLIKGVFLGIKRVFKCHPFHSCGIDSVPKK